MRKSNIPRAKIQDILKNIEEYENSRELADYLLLELQDLLKTDDVQFSLYYDLAFGMEVTHIRRKAGKTLQKRVRVQEDEVWSGHDDPEFLSPEDATSTLPLTHRDRLVGLLLCGKRMVTEQNSISRDEILEELAPVISASLDQLMMLRKVSETNQKLFENEKLISIGQLASGIAHEIRNPLSSLKINLQGLAKVGALEGRDKKRVALCLDEIERLDSIVSEMVSFARRTRLELSLAKIPDVVSRTLAMAESELNAAGIEVHTEFSTRLPEINLDETRIRQTLLNLVLNAVHAMEDSGKLTIRAEEYGDGIELRIEDTGRGIPEELLRDIFNPFFTTRASGTGLGLPNALKAVQEHGGELEVTSEEGKGTTFWMRLPKNPPAMPDDPSALRIVPSGSLHLD